jgi:hypothetical protein
LDILIVILICIAVIIFVPGADRLFWATLCMLYSFVMAYIKFRHLLG